MIGSNLLLLVAAENHNDFMHTKTSLRRWGVNNTIMRFADGRLLLDFLIARVHSNNQLDQRYLLLLESDFPKVNGREILFHLKSDNELKKLPVVVLAAFADPLIVNIHQHIEKTVLLTKPLRKEGFASAMTKLGLKRPVLPEF